MFLPRGGVINCHGQSVIVRHRILFLDNCSNASPTHILVELTLSSGPYVNLCKFQYLKGYYCNHVTLDFKHKF